MFHLVETDVVISVILVILKRNKTQKKSIVITRPPLFVYIAMNSLLFVVYQLSWLSWIASNTKLTIQRIFVPYIYVLTVAWNPTNLHIHEYKIVY